MSNRLKDYWRNLSRVKETHSLILDFTTEKVEQIYYTPQ
jgi:hypothetical protein